MSAYRDRVPHAHNLPSLEALARGMSIDHIRAFTQKENVVALEKPSSVAPDQLNDGIYPQNIIVMTDTPISSIYLYSKS